MTPDSSVSALRQALRSGAEIGLARAMLAKSRPEAVSHFEQTRLANLSPAELDSIRGLSSSIIESGIRLTSQAPEEEISAEDIPTNPDLFGDEWEGKRIFWFGEWSIPGSGEWQQFSGTLPALTTLADLQAYAEELARSYIEAYPTKFLGELGEDTGEVSFILLGTEKAF